MARMAEGTSVGGPTTTTSAPSFRSPRMLLRATRRVGDVADDGDLQARHARPAAGGW